MHSKQGLLSSLMVQLLIVVSSGCRMWAVERQASGLALQGLNSCGSRALEHTLNSFGPWA